MKLDPVRLKRQRQIVHDWIYTMKGRGGFMAATGFGKTFTAIEAIRFLRRKGWNKSILVVVPNLYLVDQWKDRLIEHNIDNVHVTTIQSLIRWPDKDVGLLILDELHSYTSDIFSNVFDIINYELIMGMTATLREDPDRQEIIDHFCPIFDEVTLTECLENGWVSDFVVYNLGIELDEKTRSLYKSYSEKFNRAFAVFGHDLSLGFKCLNNEHARKQLARQLQWNTTRVHNNAINMARFMGRRKQLLYNYSGILDKAVETITYFPNRKIITFNQSTDFADRITGRLPDGEALSYHSNLEPMLIGGKLVKGKTKIRNYVMEMFKEGNIRVINTAKALDEGTDIEDIDMSVICSGTASELQSLQRTGRNIRFKPGKQAIELNLFITGTQSQKWLRTRQRKHPKSAIKYISNLNEIVV